MLAYHLDIFQLDNFHKASLELLQIFQGRTNYTGDHLASMTRLLSHTFHTAIDLVLVEHILRDKTDTSCQSCL